MKVLSILFIILLAVSFVNRVGVHPGFMGQAVASENEGGSAGEPEATPAPEGTTEEGTETAPTPEGDEEPPN
jgi:hypothetical protein